MIKTAAVLKPHHCKTAHGIFRARAFLEPPQF
jgi:hypothetical protein